MKFAVILGASNAKRLINGLATAEKSVSRVMGRVLQGPATLQKWPGGGLRQGGASAHGNPWQVDWRRGGSAL